MVQSADGSMSNYRRIYVPGATVFLTWVTYNRDPIFAQPHNVGLLRKAVEQTKNEIPFQILAAVVLPDHVHFMWQLPDGDNNYSKRVGRIKTRFTRLLRGIGHRPINISWSRQKHRESNVWQRRFWEKIMHHDKMFANHLNYIHYNPVKHGLVQCPHQWQHSSFQKWVKNGHYPHNWKCQCQDTGGWAPPTREGGLGG